MKEMSDVQIREVQINIQNTVSVSWPMSTSLRAISVSF